MIWKFLKLNVLLPKDLNRVFRFSGILSNSAISLRIRAVGKKILSDIVLETLFLLVNLKIQSFLAINRYRILFSRGLVI